MTEKTRTEYEIYKDGFDPAENVARISIKSRTDSFSFDIIGMNFQTAEEAYSWAVEIVNSLSRWNVSYHPTMKRALRKACAETVTK